MSKSKADSSSITQLAMAIGQAARSAKFFVAGSLPAVDPGLIVEGMGAVQVPLKRGAAKLLIAACQVAPYGKGTETLVDTNVRNTYELDPQKFQLSDDWNATITDATRTIADSLGLPADRLEAKLYKLLMYEKGGFFLPHRDSEKHDRMVASLIVVLPNPFEGGALTVHHGDTKDVLKFKEASTGVAPSFAAFYADCEHEVGRVTKGVRLALAYNLVLKPQPKKRSAPAAPDESLTAAIGSWVVREPSKPLVFALDHHYTQRGLSLDLLKGADRELADMVVSAAAKADCLVHLAQVSRHLMQAADDGSYDHGYSRYSRRAPRKHAIEIGETYEDELIGTEWANLEGQKQPLGTIAFDLTAIVSTVPINDWKPTSEDYEGYTGNAGNTLDRWYHRSAIVVWHRDRHFKVIASSGAAVSMPLFCSMMEKLPKTPSARLEAARQDCIQFARGIVASWPARSFGYGNSWKLEASPINDFSQHLLKLHDRDTVAAFLTQMAEKDRTLPLDSFVVAVCHEFGWAAFAKELKHLISAPPNKSGQQEIPLRDVEWLSAFCCDPSADPARSRLAGELCKIAVDRFSEQRSEQSRYNRQDAAVIGQSLRLLLQALAAFGRDEDVSEVIRIVRKYPDDFSLDDCQVPSLKLLIPWSQKRFGTVHPQFQSWLDALRMQFENSTVKKPTPPTDWARPAVIDCKCEYCVKLIAFLANPTCETDRIPARENARQHVIDKIRRHQCDVTHTLERLGSPFALLLTKTNGSFERTVKRHEDDRTLLHALQSVS